MLPILSHVVGRNISELATIDDTTSLTRLSIAHKFVFISSISVFIFTLGLDVGWGVAQEVVDPLELQRVLVAPLALVVIGGLELLDIGHVNDVSVNGGEHDHGGCFELALEPNGNLSLGLEHSAATSREKFVNED